MPEQEPQAHDHEDDVRRLLAEARYDGPVPVDVAARLDRVLEQLAADGPIEDEVEAEQDPAHDLDTHRRRRRARNLLLAAAAVVVVGVGLGQLGGPGESGGDSAADGSASFDVATSRAEMSEATPSEGSLPADEGYSGSLAKRLPAPEPSTRRPVVVTDRDFASTDRLRALPKLVPTSASADLDNSTNPSGALGSLSSARSSWYACRSGPYGEGHLVAVQYDAHPAVLAVRPATGDSTVVELLRCGSGAVLRSATVPLS